MSKDGIDASLGLAFSLQLFKRYQRSGVLRAELPRAPGVRGRCNAFIHLEHGEVSAAYFEDMQGQRYSSDKESLCRLDKERGPFEWVLIPQSASSGAPQTPDQSAESDQLRLVIPPTAVPQVIAGLSQDRLSAWTPQQRSILYTTLTLINGERTVAAIKNAVPFPPDVVDELLYILLESGVIVISA